MALNLPSIASFGVFSEAALTNSERAVLYCTWGYLDEVPAPTKIRRLPTIPNIPNIPNMPRILNW